MAGPVACPVPANDVTKFDVRNASDCASLLQALLQAYANLLAGSQRIEVRFGDRWTVYNKTKTAELLQFYNMIYNQCPAAKAAGLPSLNPGLRARRGAPATGLQFFPRL